MMLVLVTSDSGDADLSTDRLGQLSRLGVTDVSVLRDENTTAVVLQGWGFDPVRSGDEARALVLGADRGRALLPVVQAAVMPTSR